MKKRKKREVHTPEFKENAVRLSKELNNRAQAARQLDISYMTLTSWVNLSEEISNKELQNISKVKIHLENLTLAGINRVEEFQKILEGILESASDDGITTFAVESEEFKEEISHLNELNNIFTEPRLSELKSVVEVNNEISVYIKSKFLDNPIINVVNRLRDNLSCVMLVT